MRPKSFTALLAAVIFCATSASAGTVDIGFLDKADYERWKTGGTTLAPTGEVACPPAKFHGISNCPTVVISNNSAEAATLSFGSDDDVFSVGEHMAITVPRGPQPCYAMLSWHLKPGHRCYAPVIFWPRTGEDHHATIHISVKTKTGATTASFTVKGTSDYPPELQAAEEVRRRHAAELMKIPHVASVELDDKDGIKIDVTVSEVGGNSDYDFEERLEQVRRQVPPKIEGYDTEVTEYIVHGFFN